MKPYIQQQGRSPRQQQQPQPAPPQQQQPPPLGSLAAQQIHPGLPPGVGGPQHLDQQPSPQQYAAAAASSVEAVGGGIGSGSIMSVTSSLPPGQMIPGYSPGMSSAQLLAAQQPMQHESYIQPRLGRLTTDRPIIKLSVGLIATFKQINQIFHEGREARQAHEARQAARAAQRVPDRPTQSSYDKPDDWVQRNRIGVKKVRGRLKDFINSVTNKSATISIGLIHNRSQQLINEYPIVWREPILDDYWEQLEAAIDRRKQLDGVTTDIEAIEITNVEITNDRLAALVAIFCNGRATNSSKLVIFNNANLCDDGILTLSKLVEVSSEMNICCLRHNQIDNMESARCLSMSLRAHDCINSLHLTHCDLGSNPEILLVILQSDVRHIDLSKNNIGSLGAIKIAEYLEGNPPIHRIDLDHNSLNDDDVILISQALKRNTSLMAIHIHTNNFSSIDVKALLTCVFDSSSLNAISESNHTLAEINVFTPSMNMSQEYINRWLKLDKTQKILLALQDKDSLLQYLANVPVGLIPEVMAFPLRWFDDQCQQIHLNIVYSTMRWWNMPMLYSYHVSV